MDSKTLKNTLKQAKEAIKNKDIDSALKLCKAVLKEDRNNYIGLVLLGAALQESDQKEQAPNAYRKAIEVSPDQLLAWQGLAVFYEKDDINKHAEQLSSVYQHLLHLESDSTKWCDLIYKVQNIVTKFKSECYMAEIIAAFKNIEDNDKSEALRKLVFHYLSHADDIPEKFLGLYEEFFNHFSTELESDQCQVYLKLLYNQKKTQELLAYAEKISENGGDVRVSEWVCKVCSEAYVEDRNNIVEWCSKLPQHFSRIFESDKDDVLALMAQGTFHMYQKAYLEARECLQHCLSLNTGLFHAVCLLAETHMQLLCPEQAIHWAQVAIKLRPGDLVPKAILAKTLSLTDKQNNWNIAVSLASEMLEEDSNELATEALCEAYLKLGQWSQLLSATEKLIHAPALAALLRLEAEVGRDQKQGLLEALAQHTPDCPQAWYRLGTLYLQQDDIQQACTSFLKCAKLVPYWYTAYLQLGNIYARDPVTLDKARRCYQRALVLNQSHVPTQIALSDTYRALGDAKSNLSLLEGISQQPEGRWAWPRLGLQYADLGDTTSAISCLRSALKSDPDNSHIWEALADAYLTRGANGSALKSYQKVLELKPGAFYPALQIATIKQITDLPEESLLEFRELVEHQPNSILALKGLCETCICLAKNFLTQRLLGLARDRLQEGLIAISSAVQVRPEVACLWKLAADCLTMAGILPPSWAFLTVPDVLSPSEKTLHRLQLLELGARCMCRCLKLMTDVNKAMVWHDLALSYYHQVFLCPADGDHVKTLCQRALAAAKESVTLDPRNWQHWNLLGIIAALPEVKKYSLAQHAFIKATMADESVAVPWANLGCLYLGLGDLKLANSAFGAGQRTDPEYCPSWVGQALIAERVNNEETMDLFRHTTQLGYHAQSCLGYAQWVCDMLKCSQFKTSTHYIYCIEKMHAVPVAVDALTWATDEEEDNACGLNMLGCLLERCGLHNTAVQVLSRAVNHVPAPHRDKVLANFARVLLKADKVEDAVQVYKAISKADIHTQCGLALALYKGKQYQESYEAYEAALNWWAADDATKAHLYVAMAAVIYKREGPDKARTLLLQGNQLKPQSVHGLFAACSLGMLNSDLELSKLMLKDLLKYQNQPEYVSHVALFQAYIKFIQGDTQGSVSSMSKTVHRQPSQAELWLHLTLLILHKQSISPDPKHKVRVAAQCAKAAITLGHTYMDVSKVMAVVSLSHLLGGDAQKALSASKRAVHLYPAVGESWAVLAASCYAAKSPAQLRPLISHARQNTDLERPLAKWMSNFERKIAISS